MISSVRIQLLLLLFVTAALEEETLWASLSLPRLLVLLLLILLGRGPSGHRLAQLRARRNGFRVRQRRRGCLGGATGSQTV